MSSEWVIWNKSQRAYVANPGLKSSYTKQWRRARKWPTKEAAQAECCGDEVPQKLWEN